MEIQLWREILHPYEQAVSEIIIKFVCLRDEFRKNNIYSPIESVTGRVKTVSSILEKMQMKNIPFDIARVYWTYDVPSGERRGGHAHRTCEEIVIAVSGSFDVEVFDGRERKTFHLNHPYQGLYIGTGVWRTLEDFSSGAVCLVLASELFDEEEYIYDYDEFLKCSR